MKILQGNSKCIVSSHTQLKENIVVKNIHLDMDLVEDQIKLLKLYKMGKITLKEIYKKYNLDAGTIRVMAGLLERYGIRECIKIFEEKKEEFTKEERDEAVNYYINSDDSVTVADVAVEFKILKYRVINAWISRYKRIKKREEQSEEEMLLRQLELSNKNRKREELKRYLITFVIENETYLYSIRCISQKEANEKAKKLAKIYKWKIINVSLAVNVFK